jgi:hypothetical protein
VVFASRFALGSAVELEDGVDADFPDPLRDGGFLGADRDFALVFVAAEFALDGHVRALAKSAGEVGQLPERDASMPLGPRFPRTGVILPGRLGGEREHRDVRCVADLPFGIAAEETDVALEAAKKRGRNRVEVAAPSGAALVC